MRLSREDKDLRSLPDRRKSPPISRHTLFGGRRTGPRRSSDRRRHIYADIYGAGLFLALLSLLSLSVLDGVLTLALVNEDIVFEANPVMGFFMGQGTTPFIVSKLVLTAGSLIIFCLYKNFTLARVSLSAAIVLYSAVIVYELNLWYKFYPPF